MTDAEFDREAVGILKILPVSQRLAVIGSTSFWHSDSQATCEAFGELLTAFPQIVLLTGGVGGVGESVGRSFHAAAARVGQPSQIFHVLPHGEGSWDYGKTLFAGENMEERREVLGRLSGLYIAIEGGPGTVHEAHVARSRGALVIPVGRSGGLAGGLYGEMNRPEFASESALDRLGNPATSPEDAAVAAFEITKKFFDHARQFPPR